MSEKLNLEIYQGDSWSRGFQIAFPNTDPPFDNTWSVKAQIRKSAKSPTVLYEWSQAHSNIEITSNVIKLFVSPSDSSAWTFTAAVYDLEISKAGVVKTILSGNIKVIPQVTR